MKKPVQLLIFLLNLISWIQAQQQHQQRNSRPVLSFQTFDHISGLPGRALPSSDLDVAGRLSAGGRSAPEYQEQPKRGNEADSLPLYKQSYPGLYVKGHTTQNFKYEPTRQVEHHHGPDYHFPRNIASSSRSEDGFGGNTFSQFN